jgi:hypothetical protein
VIKDCDMSSPECDSSSTVSCKICIYYTLQHLYCECLNGILIFCDVLFLVCEMKLIVCDVIPQYMKRLETFLSSGLPLKRGWIWDAPVE